jgi:hypothetical protein
MMGDSMGISAAVASSQGGTQLALGVSAIKNQANAQKQLTSMLDQSLQTEKLRTSGSVGTKINTTA